MRLVAGTRVGVNDPGVAAVKRLGADQTKIVSVGDLAHELAPFFALLFFFLLTLPARVIGFVLALVDFLLDFLFFFRGLLGAERLIVFLDQPLYLLAVEFHDLVGPGFGGLHLALAIELVIFVALHVGVVAQPLVVLDVLICNHTKEFAHLPLAEGAGGIGS